MTNLIEIISEAIMRQEGEGPTHKNPGNLRMAPWLKHPEIANGFWVPVSRMQGIAGLAHVVALKIAEGMSLRQLISDPVRGWAPASDGNNTAAYIANVKEWADISNVDTPLWAFLEEEIPT